ncbi:dCTP deaminase [archaeon]|jgi:dCTP deaminase|nr:dCTP deaminase [archaeon]MBT4397450.1 dCTP deaminase [archaeon]MBT4440522.1 dCTP deaminase [archaeon]
MILTRKEILTEIKEKRVKITPFSRGNLSVASYDLTLDSKFWLFKPGEIKVKEGIDFKKYCVEKNMKKITLLPGEFVLARTKEKINLPEDISGFLSGRSRFARLGLGVHVTAFFINPGVNNRQVFEIKNNSNNPLVIYPGLKIAQIIFVRNEGRAKYNGRYKKQ